jgi:hypothetical protein
VSQVKTARIKKSAKEQHKNAGNKHKSKNIKERKQTRQPLKSNSKERQRL